MSEIELKELKEQIKQEIIAEMNTKKENENNWKRIKQEYEEEFKKFNYIDHWEATIEDGRVISRDKEVNAIYPLQTAIGTLLRIVYKADTVSKMDAKYEDMKNIVEQILNILKANKKERG